MVVRAKTCLLFLFLVAAMLLSATVTVAKNRDKWEQENRGGSGGGSDGGSGSGGGWRLKNRSGDFGKGGQQESNNPYVFEDRDFTMRIESELGSYRILQKFTDRSELLRGIEEYRFGFLEAEPQTFLIPNHWDAEVLFFVTNGEGTISFINPKSQKRQTFNIKRGDIFHEPAGVDVYMINRNNNQKLVLAKIIRTVSAPGELKTFFGAGGEKRESSYLNAFSTEVLEAAFDTNRDELERLFYGQHIQKGIFRKATAEQIKPLEESKIWKYFREGERSYHIFDKKPSIQNENGHLHEVDSDDFSDLRDINVAIFHMNISKESMAGPFYHTKSTMVFVVPNGEGHFEMACPHSSEQHSRGGSNGGLPSYEKMSSPLNQGTVVVVPAGHPMVIVNTGNENLELMGFGLNSDKNEWLPVAGKDNVISEWEDEAVELTFGVPAKVVKRVTQKQKQKMFFKGPARGGRAFA